MKQKLLGISELIQKIKADLLSERFQEDTKLFSIDEITLEVNFVVSGNIEGGFDLGVVSVGSDVSEERVQKIVVKMTPLVSKEQLIGSINSSSVEALQTLQESSKTIIRSSETRSRGG